MATIVRRRAAPAAKFSEPQAGGDRGEIASVKIDGPVRVSSSTPPRTHTNSRSASTPLSKEELIAAVEKDLMDMNAVSAFTGLPPRTLSIYHTRGSMPEPDIRKGSAPLWHRETIEEWESTRPKRTKNRA